MQVQAPPTLVAVRNTKGGPTVFKDEAINLVVTWEGAGDPHGRDLQYIPDNYLSNISFARMVSNGTFDIPEEFRASVPHLSPHGFVPGGDLADEVAGAMHRPEDRDLIAQPCIAPGTRPGASCSEQGLTNSKGSVPPLCSAHKGLEASCVEVQTELGPQWVVATMGQRVAENQITGAVPTA